MRQGLPVSQRNLAVWLLHWVANSPLNFSSRCIALNKSFGEIPLASILSASLLFAEPRVVLNSPVHSNATALEGHGVENVSLVYFCS